MTITLQPAEIDKLYVAVGDWYAERAAYVFDRLVISEDCFHREFRNPKEQIAKLYLEFSKEHPMPDWRKLL